MEALEGLISSIPEWHTLLNDLNSKITSRQIELAQLGEYRPPTRSLKNKGSTESLRRKDLTEDPQNEWENTRSALQVTSEPLPTLTRLLNSPALSTPASPAILTPTKASAPAPLQSHNSSPEPGALQRRISNRIANLSFAKPSSPPILRKRKTASVASNDSQVPKYRTRSMIIVYYDSAVQHAFEELVKHISASRNAMRKGKMAARMAEMRRLADMETGSSDEDDDNPENPPVLDKKPLSSFMKSSRNGHAMAIRQDVLNGDGDTDMDAPKLQFVSTRRMGPSRDMIAAAQKHAPPTFQTGATPLPLSPGLIHSRAWRGFGLGSSGALGPGSIFDDLDTGLEWCQSMCEHAAHQFLRDGDCSIEIEGIKRRLNEVKEAAEKNQTTGAPEEVENDSGQVERNAQIRSPDKPRGEMYDGSALQNSKIRSLKAIQMRRTPCTGPAIVASVPIAMEVDDEGFEDDDEELELPKLVWRSARDM